MTTASYAQKTRIFARPTAKTGVWSWLTTVDHKRIGILYGATAIAFFVIGGLEALFIRLQLARPEGNVLSAEQYNQLFTMHGLTMIFLVVMPLGAAFFNYMMPIMIGARDVAFPRLNAFSYWVFLFGGIFLYSSFFINQAPDGGWFGYAPLSVRLAGHGMTFYSLGLIILGLSSTVAAVNFLTTIINMRAPGMSLMRMPVFVWMTFVVQFLLVFALPVLTVALFQLFFDRSLGTSFFSSANGTSDPVLWQHLFWLFGHPEVYVLILPAMGIVSEVLPVFSRKPLFGYPVVVFSGIAIGFMGWGVWAHHMFAVGLGPVANTAFALSTMFIAVPTGVKIFNWMATLYGGSIRFTTPMLFALGFIANFTVGGLSGVTHALVPHDYQQTDTYYIVAHFHYVLFGGAILGLFAGLYYWWPKIFGKLLDEKIGKWNFWLMVIGFNLTFAPMHILGLQGMARRTYRYPKGYGFDFWNLISTFGAFLIAISVLVFFYNVYKTRKYGKAAGNDPWDARTLEWTVSSPPPEHNFDEIPIVHALDDFWHRKYVEDKEGRLVPVPSGGQDPGGDHAAHATESQGESHGEGHAIHMPSQSYMPLIAALGMPLVGWGLTFRQWWLAIIGAVVAFAGLYAWALEPATEE
jgi:cytochrome c oxidase subunit 1